MYQDVPGCPGTTSARRVHLFGDGLGGRRGFLEDDAMGRSRCNGPEGVSEDATDVRGAPEEER